MSNRYFIDTNILLYAYDHDSGDKQSIAQEVFKKCWQDLNGIISIQVLCEFFVRATRDHHSFMSIKEARSIVYNLSQSFEIVDPDSLIVLKAIDIKEKYKLSFWDSLIWATANKAQADIIYSEDFQHKQVIDGIQLINPFKL